MIEVRGLTKTFGEVTALDDVSFTVEKGQIVGFLGANGAGKTTTMDIICGCIGADAGTAVVAGHDITEEPLKAKAKLGYLPDVPPLHLEMRVVEFIEYAGKLRGLSGQRLQERISDVISVLELQPVQDRVVGNLSKGYRQRVGLAQAIVHDPDVLVLDEPTEGLDPNQIAHIRQMIKSLAGKHTIILSSHILSEVQNTCDHLIIIHRGKIVQQGSYEQLVDQMEKGAVYQLRVAREPQKLVGAISAVKGVEKVEDLTDGSFDVTLKTDDPETTLDHVTQEIVKGGYGLRELSQRRRSLEDVFFEITQ